jgi:subtilisin family serine protease
MKKRAFFACILFTLLVISISNLSLSKQDKLNEIKALNQKTGKINAQVLNELEKQDKVKVIVKLKDAQLKKGAGIFSQARKEMEKSREDAINLIGKEKADHTFLSSNSFSAKLSQDDLKKLASDANVEQVYYDIPVHAFLQDSVGIINANITWPLQINYLNFTGQGQSVCIIDTGINYSHSALGGCSIRNLSLSGNNISYVLQTAHNYNNNNDTIWKINYTGFSNIAVHFVNISLEYQGEVNNLDSSDRVIIYNSNMTEIASYHGINGVIQDKWTPSALGDTIYVRLVTDSAITDYGFYIDQIINGTTNMTYNWSSCSKTIFGWDFVNNDPDPYDDNGHGTHVAGIVSANGSISGVAPNANLVIAKGLDSSGSGWTSDIMYAIDWCVNNSEKYNISVISMSLGEGSYSNYCDSLDTLTSSAINSAAAKNISVVIATGNSGSSTQISWPSCIQNATPIGSTTKTDSISSFSNRNSLVKLFAPGGASTGSTSCSPGNMPENYICSTDENGGYIGYSGTSMATPYVAGAIAIFRQALTLLGKSKTPKQIEAILNNTGKQIYDSSSGLTFSRIDLYSALLSLDENSPNITLISPQNSITNTTINQSFTCNITDDFQLKNTTLFIWNSTSLYIQNTTSFSGISAQVTFNISNMPQDRYFWNYYSCDLKNNCSFALSNFSIVIGSLYSYPAIPANSNYTKINMTNFTCLSYSEQLYSLKNISIYIWNSSSLIYNETRNISGFSNTTIFNYTFLIEENYKWNCLSSNNQTNSSLANSNFTITYDITNPNLTLITDSESYTSNSQLAYFYFNLTDLSPTNCSLIVNNAINQTQTISALNNQIQNLSQTFSPGAYSWQINCSDYAGNNANTTQKTLTITAPVTTTSSGGGGGGGGAVKASIYSATEAQLSSGTSFGVGGGEKIIFALSSSPGGSSGGEAISSKANHTITINKVSSNYANITIQSNPVNLILYVGNEKKLNMSSPDYYDLYIRLNSISNNKANITIKSINEKIIKISDEIQQGNKTQNNFNKSSRKVSVFEYNNKYLTYIFIILVIGIIVFAWIYSAGRKDKNDETKQKIKAEKLTKR